MSDSQSWYPNLNNDKASEPKPRDVREWVRFVFLWAGMLLILAQSGLAQWTEPERFPLEHGTAIAGPWITNDNLRLYASFSGYIFVTERASVDSPWVPFHTVGNWVNSGLDQGSPCESPTGDTLYFMSYGRAEPSFGLNDIYYTIRTDSGWFGPIINCGPNINSQYIEWSVGISRDGSKLLVAADRIPGHGGMDIYFCDKQEDGTWGPLQDFGPNINTDRTEEHPTLASDHSRLFFYKQGPRHGDVWNSQFVSGTWQIATSLPDPINTLDWTEMDPCFAADDRTLYFLSDVGDNNDFQIYVSIDTSVIAIGDTKPQKIEVSPALFCICDDQHSLALTVMGVEQARTVSITIFDLLGREVHHQNVNLSRSGQTLNGRIALPRTLSSGTYIVSLQAGVIRLSERFQLTH